MRRLGSGIFAAAVLLASTGCETAPPPPERATPGGRGTPEVEPAAAGRGAHATPSAVADGREGNRVMGTGEPREPQPFTREQQFLEAARQGDLARAARALDLGVGVDAKDDLGRSALLLAARDAGDLELVRFLHGRGAALDTPDLGGRTALSFASGAGRLDIVGYLVAQGARIDRADKQGRAPLFHAVLGNRRDVAAYLIERGAAVDVRDRFADTPLIVACAKGYAEMAALLLDHGADPSLRDQEGRTAAERSAPGVEICRPRES